MAVKKIAAKKMIAKKLAVSAKKASPMKQKDSAAIEKLKKEQNAKKEADVKSYQLKMEAENKKGLTPKAIAGANALVSQGSVKQGGVGYNFLTGQSTFDNFTNTYVKGGTYDKVVNTKTKKVVAEAKNPIASHTSKQGFQAYLNPKNTTRMGNEDVREQFIIDSTANRGNQEKQLLRFKNAKLNSGR